ncbi:hypothetical protein ACTXT7_015796 [Hymenolepis weldensis]
MRVPLLSDLCATCIASNIDNFITKISDFPGHKYAWRSANFNVRMGTPTAERILEELSDLGLLENGHLVLFSKSLTSLKSVSIKNAHIGLHFLRIFLSNLKLTEITVSHMPEVTVEDVMSSVRVDTFESLRSLDINNMTIMHRRMLTMEFLVRFRNLEALNVSRTTFDSECLCIVVQSLRKLQSLDISATNVNDIGCLTALKTTMRELKMDRLTIRDPNHSEIALLTILELKELEILSVVNDRGDLPRSHTIDSLCKMDALPNLRHLDISGNLFSLTTSDIDIFVENHPNLEILALFYCRPNLSEQLDALLAKYPRITFIGDCCERHWLDTMQVYWDCPNQVHKAMSCILTAIRNGERASHNKINAVLCCAEMNSARRRYPLECVQAIKGFSLHSRTLRLTTNSLDRIVQVTFNYLKQKVRKRYDTDFIQILNNLLSIKDFAFDYKACCELVFQNAHYLHFGPTFEVYGKFIRSISEKTFSKQPEDEDFFIEAWSWSLRKESIKPARQISWRELDLKKSLLELSKSDWNELKPNLCNMHGLVGFLTSIMERSAVRPSYIEFPRRDSDMIEALSVLLILMKDCPEAFDTFNQVNGLSILKKIVMMTIKRGWSFYHQHHTLKCLENKPPAENVSSSILKALRAKYRKPELQR